ncbi:hypothetical protein ACFH04_08085 [Streptomyces noboritoensis]|uniref:Uncharacterized protein n=1 Tax=Streptomyces noboritoensis TaxID=67337 RepID=A0ABV6TGQ2_9ACTN
MASMVRLRRCLHSHSGQAMLKSAPAMLSAWKAPTVSFPAGLRP